jgi:hypothetical protein
MLCPVDVPLIPSCLNSEITSALWSLINTVYLVVYYEAAYPNVPILPPREEMFMILPPPFCLKKGIIALVQFSMAEIILNDKMQKDYTEIGDTLQKIQTSAISSWVCDT